MGIKNYNKFYEAFSSGIEYWDTWQFMYQRVATFSSSLGNRHIENWADSGLADNSQLTDISIDVNTNHKIQFHRVRHEPVMVDSVDQFKLKCDDQKNQEDCPQDGTTGMLSQQHVVKQSARERETFQAGAGGNTSVSVARDGVVSNAEILDTIEEKWFAMNRFEGQKSLWLNDATQMYLQRNPFPEIFLFHYMVANKYHGFMFFNFRQTCLRRDSWHHGGWTKKIAAWILLVILVTFLPFLVITVYETLSKFCVVLHPRGSDSLLHAVVVSVYLAFGSFTSLFSEPRDYVCSGHHYKSSIVSTGTLIIEILKSSVIYSALRAGSLTPFLAPLPSSRADVDPKDKWWLYLSIIMGFIVEFRSVCGTLEIVSLKAPSFGKHKSQYLVSIAILIVGIAMGDEVEKYALVEIDTITLEVISGSKRIEKINPFKVLEVSRNHFQLLVLQEFDPLFPVYFDGTVFQLVIYEGILHTYLILNLEDKVLFEGGGNVMDRTNTIGYGQPDTTAKRTAQQLNQQPNMRAEKAGSEPMRLDVYVCF
ncbi:hypothetical protein V6N13_141218 [Hibiscus sabdariffa]